MRGVTFYLKGRFGAVCVFICGGVFVVLASRAFNSAD